MSMADRIRRAERVLLLLERAGHTAECDELRRLFNEYAGEIRHLEEVSSVGTILDTNTASLARVAELLSASEPHAKSIADSQARKARVAELWGKAKVTLITKINPLHITLTVILIFGLIYAFLGYPMPRWSDVSP